MQRQSSNENLIRNLQNQDFGSYPRRASSSNLNGNISNTSFHTRDSSITSVNKADALEDVFATPKSGAPSQLPSTFDRNNEDSDDRRSGDDDKVATMDKDNGDLYKLQNNYDMSNIGEIAEEDQYENEFTNYSQSKREFIESLRPK